MSYGKQAAERIAGSTVLITGASAGIGEAIARELAAAANGNIKLVLAARRVDRLDSLKSSLTTEFKTIQVHALKLDVSDHGSIAKSLDTLPSAFAKIDILVNNAGMVHGRDPVGSIAPADVDIMFNTNVLGLIQLTQLVVAGMKERNFGDVVTIGSIAGREPYSGGAIYCATKAAVRSFATSLRKETLDKDIRVINIDPGAVETEFSVVRFRGDKAKADAVYADHIPLVADDIADFAVFALTRRRNMVVADALLFPSDQGGPADVYRRKLDK